MSGIESEVHASFLLELEQNEIVDASVVEGLRILTTGEKLPKPEQLVALYAAGSGDPLA